MRRLLNVFSVFFLLLFCLSVFLFSGCAQYFMLMDEEEKMLAMLQLGFWPLFDARSRVN